MMTRAETLAQMIETSTPLATRYFAGFNDNNRATQAPGLPNHFAWILGHCSLTMHRMAERLDGKPLPEGDFQTGVERAAGSPPDRFGTEGVSFDSIPVAEADAYPLTAKCVEVFGGACMRLALAVGGASDDRFNVMEAWGASELSMADLVVRVNLHNAMHAGQLVDLRRALGFGRVIV